MVLSRQKFEDPSLQRFHDDVAERVDGSPFTANGRQVTVESVAVGVFTVWHRLGRVPSRWAVVDQEVSTLGSGSEHGVYYFAGDAKDKNKLVLRASASYNKLVIWVS